MLNCGADMFISEQQVEHTEFNDAFMSAAQYEAGRLSNNYPQYKVHMYAYLML